MRVVLSSPRKGWGGTATVARSLVRGLGARGHEVVVFCKPGSALHERFGPLCPCAPILHGVDFPPGAVGRVVRALRRRGTDVVLSLVRKDLALTGLGARLAGVPLVAHRAEMEPFRPRHPVRALLDRLPDRWVAASRANHALMLATGPWLTAADVTLIHNGIDPAPYRDAVPADLELPGGAVAVGYVGRLVEEKGLGELARAWRQMAAEAPGAWLVVAGEGPWGEELRRLLSEAPRVRWLGFRRDVGPVLAALDVVAMPSWEEPFGLVALEAMAAGRPVVATGRGGLTEVVVDGETGLLIPARDPEALARALGRLVAGREERTRMGQAGAARVAARFSEEAMVAAYEEVLTEVAARRRP